MSISTSLDVYLAHHISLLALSLSVQGYTEKLFDFAILLFLIDFCF